MTSFIGRRQELSELEKLSKSKANLVVLKGRRRIGKSRFVEEFGKDKTFIRFSGVPSEIGTTDQMQKDIFTKQLSKELNIPYTKSDDWSNIFDLLAYHVKALKENKKRCVILFDEISWMGSKDPTFLGNLKNAWDIHFSKIDGLILVLCGSVSTWIEENIIKSTGFFGRISLYLRLEELSIAESNLFLDNQGFCGGIQERFKLLSVFGGVPWYLEHINGKLTADDNIRDLFFKKDALLFHEFNLIFHDLFGASGTIYKKIIEFLALKSSDLQTIGEQLNYSKSGNLSKYLENLIEASFVSRDFTWDIKDGSISRLSAFRLSDNYLRFYMKYVAHNKEQIQRGKYTNMDMASLPEWNAIMGLQFENLVLKNRDKIKKILGIKPQDVIVDNPFFQRKSTVKKGCQIDYMIQTRFKTIFICEIKFLSKEIQSSIIEEMKDKLSRLSLPRGFAFCPILIHVNGVSDALSDRKYFTEIIDFGQLIEG